MTITRGAIQLAEGIPTNTAGFLNDLKGDIRDPEVRSRINSELRRLTMHIQVWPNGECPRISHDIIEGSRDLVAASLTGNRGIEAKANGQLIGAIELVFPSGRRFASLWTHRPRSRDPQDWEPDCHGWNPDDGAMIRAEKQDQSR